MNEKTDYPEYMTIPQLAEWCKDTGVHFNVRNIRDAVRTGSLPARRKKPSTIRGAVIARRNFEAWLSCEIGTQDNPRQESNGGGIRPIP